MGALVVEVINVVCWYMYSAHTRIIINTVIVVVLLLIVPVAVLLINVVVVIQVRRSAIHAAANLGVQPHHQSTSAVPTIMLVATSLIYVLFNTVLGSLYVLSWLIWQFGNNFSIKTTTVDRCSFVVFIVWRLIFAYNFYVYLITGKQFRSDLHKLLCRCLSSSSSAPSHAHALGALGAPAPGVIVAAGGNDDDDAEVARRAKADTAV